MRRLCAQWSAYDRGAVCLGRGRGSSPGGLHLYSNGAGGERDVATSIGAALAYVPPSLYHISRKGIYWKRAA